MLTLAVDAGTSVIKAVAFDEGGQIVSLASRQIPTSHPFPGAAEQDMRAVIEATGQAIRECAIAAPARPDLLAITAQGDGLWLADDDGHPVRPAILWSDSRAAGYVREWFDSGVAAAAFRLSGNVPFSGSAAALITALHASEPESLERAATAASCKDILLQAFTGERCTDVSDASLPFLDPRSRTYDEALVDLFRVRRWRHLLPPIDPPPGTLHALNGPGASLTGLREGTPVHAGPFDFPATCIGAGLSQAGEGLIALGTTLACGVYVSRLDTSGEPSGMTISMPERNRWVRLLPAMAGMSALDWFLPLIGVAYQQLNALIAAGSPGSGGVITLPFFSLSGERAPFVDAAARGRLIGLSAAATRADLARSLCEGIAYTARHCLEAGGIAPGATVTLCGGGSRATAFRQLLADVLGRPVLLGRQPETGARGAAITALQAAGHAIDHSQWTDPDDEVSPNPAFRALYDEGYRRYLEEVAAARGRWTGPQL